MEKKPPSCEGCPLFTLGQGFVPDQRVEGAKTELVMAMPEVADVTAGRAVSNGELDRSLLPLAGESRETVSISHLIRCRWRGAKSDQPLPPAALLNPAIEHCQVHEQPQSTVTLRVAIGEQPWKVLSRNVGTLEDWRGFLAPPVTTTSTSSLPGAHETTSSSQPTATAPGPASLPQRRVLGVKHPSTLKGAGTGLLAMKMDYQKIRRFHQQTWPRPLPPSLRWQHAQTAPVAAWLAAPAPYVVIDTEYTWPGQYLTMVGLYKPTAGTLQWMRSDPSGVPMGEVTRALRQLVGGTTVVFHNSFADLPVLERNLGLRWADYKEVRDSMLLDAVLWSEQSHRLEYLASLHGQHEKMKHLMATDPWLYNEGDVVETANVWEALQRQLEKDPRSKRVYEELSLPLIPIIRDTEERGIAIRQEEAEGILETLKGYQEEAQRVAEAYSGYPLNLGSPTQLKHWFTQMEGLKVKGVGADDIAALRGKYLAVDPDEEPSPLLLKERLSGGGHPLIESRVLFSAAGQIESHYIRPMVESAREKGGRIYPRYSPWTQANGRWSITEPPLQQMPSVVKPLLVPDKGWPWFMWDWSQAELRLIAALSGDKPLLEAFANNWDVHTIHACQALGLPLPSNYRDPHKSPEDEEWRSTVSWQGKEDIRRTFGKQFTFRLCYGGDPRFALDIPGARQMGLDGSRLEKAAKLWLRAHPAIERYWKQSIARGLAAGESRNFYGRARRFLSQDVKGRTRELYNHPLQAGVADWKNEVIIRVWNELPREEVHFIYEVHDFLCYAVREDTWQVNTDRLRAIAQQEKIVNGVPLALPADFKEKW